MSPMIFSRRLVHHNRSPWTLALLLGILLGTLATAGHGAESSGSRYPVGSRVRDALLQLEQEGLEIFYTDHLIPESLAIRAPVTATEPRAALAELLEPHDLTYEARNGARLVIVREPTAPGNRKIASSSTETGEVRGELRSTSGWVIPFARVSLAPPGDSAGKPLKQLSDKTGQFLFPQVPGGHWNLTVEASGFSNRSLEVTVAVGKSVEVNVELEELPITEEEISVSASYSLFGNRPGTGFGLSQETIAELPHFGEDLMRAIQLLPGASGSEFSAQFNLRGGPFSELLVLLDGVELFEPFHLKDIGGGFLSIVDPSTIAAVQVLPGAFPAPYGDRMTGVIDMTTRRQKARAHQFGLSFTTAWAATSGTFADGRGHYLGSLRRGYLDVVLEITEDESDFSPNYWDASGVLGFDLTPRQTLELRFLAADDKLNFNDNESNDEFDQIDSGYGNSTFALQNQATLAGKHLMAATVSAQKVTSERFFLGTNSNGRSQTVADWRELAVLGLRLDLVNTLPWGAVTWGSELRTFDADYNYESDVRQCSQAQLQDPRLRPVEFSHTFLGHRESHTTAAWSSVERRWGRLSTEAGLRFDRQSNPKDDQWAPRINLAFDLGSGGVLRAGWGHFYQSHRVHELAIEDGDPDLFPAERSEHFHLGWEKVVRKGVTLRLEAYRRDLTNPRRRFENLFDPIGNVLPEISTDRYAIEPTFSRFDGVEALIGRSSSRGVSGWLSLSYADAYDRIGGRNVPRTTDQSLFGSLSLTFRPSPRWTLSLVQQYSEGSPTTEVSLGEREVNGRIIPSIEVGPSNGGRLSAYHRLDVRASRRVQRVRRGELSLYLDVQNLYDRENPAGTDSECIHITTSPSGQPHLELEESTLIGIIPSFGISWRL